MKKWFSWMLALSLLLCCVGAQAEEEPKYFYSDNPDIAIHQVGYPRQCYFSDGEAAYRLADGELWMLDKDFEPAAKLCDTTAMAGYACEGGIVLACPTEKGYRFEWLDGEVLFEAESDRLIREFVIVGDCLAARWMYTDGDEGEEDGTRLTAYHLDGQEISVPFESVFDMDPADNGEIWVLPSDVGYGRAEGVFLWNPETGKTRQWQTDIEMPAAICNLPVGFACAALHDDVYVEEMPGEARSVGRIEYDGGYGMADYGLFARGTKVCFYNYIGVGIDFKGKLEHFVFDLEQKAENVLTLVNCAVLDDERMRTAVSMFEAEHPGMRVQFEEIEGEQLNTMLMAKEEGLDVLYLSNYDVPTYVEAGVLADLNESPEVEARLVDWIDLDGVTTWKGMRFGILAEMSIDGMQMNESLAEYLPEGLNPKELSWRELLEAGAKFNGDTNGDGHADIRLWCDNRRFPMFLFQYMAAMEDPAEIDFDTEEFRELMGLYRQCMQGGGFADAIETDPDTAIFTLGSIDTLNTVENLPLPALEGAPATTCSIFAMGVNRASLNRELAMEFLANYASVEAQSKGGYGDSTDRDYRFSCLKDSSVHEEYAELSEGERATLEANKRLFSGTRMRVMLQDFTVYCGDQIEAYLDGQIELDELIQNLQQRKQMVLMG